MARIHQILSVHATPFLHTHPFAYISIVFRGGYSEQVLKKDGTLVTKNHSAPSIIIRRSTTPHRISAVKGKASTLFLTWKTKTVWGLQTHPEIKAPAEYNNLPDGVYPFENGFRKRENSMWFVLTPTYEEAEASIRLSIHQNLVPQS